MQAVADEPTNCDIDRCFSHQLSVVHDTEKQACEHQSDRHFRIDPWTTSIGTVNFGDLFT